MIMTVSMPASDGDTARRPATRRTASYRAGPFRAGLAVLGVLSLGDLAAPLLTDGESPPMPIALIGCALGVVSLVLLAVARRGRVAPAVGLIAVRVVSALTAVPGLVFEGVPTGARILAGIAVALTLAGCVLVLTGLRRPALAGAR
jgi:hypothetical protein